MTQLRPRQLEIMNRQLEEVIVLLKDIKLLLQNSDSQKCKHDPTTNVNTHMMKIIILNQDVQFFSFLL